MQEGEIDAVAVVHSYEDGMPPGSHKTRLIALNVFYLKGKSIWHFVFLFSSRINLSLAELLFPIIGSSYGFVLPEAFGSRCVSSTPSFLVSYISYLFFCMMKCPWPSEQPRCCCNGLLHQV